MELVLKDKNSQQHFSFLCDIADAFMNYSKGKFHPKKYSFIGHIMEDIVKIELSATGRKNTQSNAVDFNLPDGKTLQLKTSHISRDEITCTYDGTEEVDSILVLNIDTDNRKVHILYYGPFKPFILHINAVTRVLPKDGHILPKKTVVRDAQEKFGYKEFNHAPHTVEQFI